MLTLVSEIQHDRNDHCNHCYYYTQNATNTIFVTGLNSTHVSDNLAKGLKTVKATIEEGPGVDVVF